MKDRNGNTIKHWFFDNSWTLMVVLISFIVAFAILRYQVSINTGRIYALEEKVNAYPTEQYFDLRFANIEKSLEEVKSDLKAHIAK